jgi:predicted ArsR family transcriptional regulator
MNHWGSRPDPTTRGRLIALLRAADHTVDELAVALELTDNAIRAQLASLERDGIVETRGLRRGAGKPSVLYGVTADYETARSRAYIPFAVTLLDELASRMPAGRLKSMLRAAGRRWAAGFGAPTGNVRAKARAAADLLRELGGQVEVVEERDGRLVLQGASCPLSAVVQSNPGACTAVESLLSELLETPVQEACDRTGARPRCRFLIGGARQG